MKTATAGLYESWHEHDACGVGFIVNINGEKSHDIIDRGVTILCNLEHRGAIGGDQKTGDGAGMLLQIPDRFFRKVLDFNLPAPGGYGAGFLFLPRDAENSRRARAMIAAVTAQERGTILGWREVPTNPDCLGEFARNSSPAFWQVFMKFGDLSDEALERKLYIVRKCLENEAAAQGWDMDNFYLPSFSSRIIVYKGMFVSTQFVSFYPDLLDPDFVSAISMVHQRYSTNTFPSWPLAQPFRYLAHNGEINTLRGNINKIVARYGRLESKLLGNEINKIYPIVNPAASDSAILDNVYELLTVSGRSLEHALIMMIPEAFGQKYHISQDKRAFFEYHAAIMDPWDGPAAVAFCNGQKIGACLDRNGLRPCRYVITKSGQVIMASETGVLDIAPEEIREKGRLSPGKMFIVDTVRKRVIRDNEIKSAISRWKPYRRWLEENKIELKGLFQVPGPVGIDKETLRTRQIAFGYTMEDLQMIIIPMVKNSQEPLGSMGNDAAPAVLSSKPQLLYNYFQQIFAQVTNPPIDPYRENLVMSLMSFIGRQSNLLEETPQHCRQLKLYHPVLTNDDIERLRNTTMEGFRVCTVPMLFDADRSGGKLEEGLARLCEEVERKVDEGYSLIIVSDRNISRDQAAIPTLLAASTLNNHLVRSGKRHLSALIMETGEVREVHHFAMLSSYGASGVNPYLVFETLIDLKEQGYLDPSITLQTAIIQYISAVRKGLLKIMSKIGISTIRSYRGAQTFEAIGLNQKFMQRYFPGTASQIGGVDIDVIEKETLQRHFEAFDIQGKSKSIDSGGQYLYRRFSENHAFSPEMVTLLQKAVRSGDYGVFKQYSNEVNDVNKNLCSLKGLFQFKKGKSIPLAEVEAVESIVTRFVTSAMSFGAISIEAHETLAVAMNRLGARSNSGEGGEDERRYQPAVNGDSSNSKVKQVASARFGVNISYLVNAEELQIKMAQGAKPGEGGQLPGFKVDDVIARVRYSTPGVMLISPPPHHDIYSIEDLSQLIFDLRNANPAARISVKLVAGVGVGTVAAGVAKAKADMVLISGQEGGTGASPLSSIKHAGSCWEIGLAEVQQVLVRNRLRDRIRVQVDGGLKTGRDVVIAALLGAEEFGFGTTALVSLGCLLVRKCHLNNCPVGIATQNPVLRKKFSGKPEHVMNMMKFIAAEVREIMAELGFRTVEEMIGRVDLLEMNPAIEHYKTKGLDFSKVFYQQDLFDENVPRHCVKPPAHDLAHSLDESLIEKSREAIEHGKKIEFSMNIRNFNRSVGGRLSAEIARHYGSKGLPADSIKIKFTGSAGQSFGSFLAPGISFELEGDSNDYLGKGLSGGKIIIYPPQQSSFLAQNNVIAGNANLFGATGGEAYINGMVGERFCVRNSGAIAVVEGVGDHGCEYMTGGRVIVIGKTGVNFAAGMSGGIAYVLDENQLFDTRCNLEMVEIEPVAMAEDINFLHTCLQNHYRYTKSDYAALILNNWEDMLPYFVKVMPIDYRHALMRIQQQESRETDLVGMTEEVFI